VGLIDRHGQYLKGKTFIYYSDPDRWFIAKVTRVFKSTHFPFEDSLNEVLQIEFHIVFSAHNTHVTWFQNHSSMDKGSMLVENSLELRKYLKLFNGTN